jgi:hypothetical protein
VALGEFKGSRVALGGHIWPQRVAGGLSGARVGLRVMDGPVGLQIASGSAGDLMGS